MKSPLRLALPLALPLLAACPQASHSSDGGEADASMLPAPEVSTVLPTHGLVAGNTAVTVTGANFEDGVKVLFGANEGAQVTVVNSRKLTARSPAAAEAGPVNVTVVNPDGQSASLPNGFLYETTSKSIDEAVVQNDLSTEDSTGANPVQVTVLADVSVPTVTAGAGEGAGIKAQVGWTTLLTSTPQASDWTWQDATYASDVDGAGPGDLARDRYSAQLSLAGATGAETKAYSLAARFSLDNGATWTFADKDGAANGITSSQIPKVTVTRPLVDWCKLGGETPSAPPSLSLKAGQPGVVLYSQVFKSGVTNQTGAGAGIAGQVGYGAPGSDPAGWTWTPATFNKDSGAGANDEFQATLPNPGVGSYAFAFRYALSGGPYRYCDADGATFTADQAGALTVAPRGVDCSLQSVAPSTVESGGKVLAFGRVFVPGVTEAPDAGAGIRGQVGVGNGNASTSTAFGWKEATYSGDPGTGEDEYQVEFQPAYTGTREVSFRVSLDDGGTWIYCDRDGSGNGYDPAQQWGLTVTNHGDFGWCNLQWPLALDGGAVSVFGRAFKAGLTPDAGAPISAWLGYGNKTEDPGLAWTWTPATFAGVKPDSSNEYVAPFPALDAGTWYYAYRFQNGSAPSYCYGDLDGSGNSAATGHQGFNGENGASENLGVATFGP